MKDIRIIQYEKVRELYQDLIKLASRQFSKSDVEILRNRILNSTEELPMCGKYRVGNNATVDIQSLNAELGLAKADIESIFTYFTDLSYKKREMEYVIETYANYTKEKVKKANRDIMSLSSGKFVNGVTFEIPFQEYADESLTTASIADEKLSLPVSETTATSHLFEAREISIKRLGPEYRVKITGDPVNIFNPGRNEKLIMQLFPGQQNSYKTCGFQLDITAYLKDINYIFVRCIEPGVGMNVKIETLESNKSRTIYNNVINTDTVDVTFDRRSVNRVTASFTMDLPNQSKDGEQYYEFILESFRIMNTIREQDCQYVTTAIAIENDVDYVQLVKEEEITGDASIKYYLTSKADANGKPTAFSEVLLEDDVFTLSSQKQQVQIVPKDSIWNITRDISKGRRLYNILECIDNIDYGFIKVTDGSIVIDTDEIELIQDGIKLFNGIGNYLIETSDDGSDYASATLSYPTTYNPTRGWVDPLPLKINVDREPISEITYNNILNRSTMALKYGISVDNKDYIKFYDSDNKVFDTTILEISSNSITLSGQIDNSNKLYIDYVSQLKDYMVGTSNMELDYTSVAVTVNDTEYEMNKDFLVNTSESFFSVELLKTGRYMEEFSVSEEESGIVNESPNVNIKFKYKAYGINPSVVFTTKVYCNRYTDITILPFTPEEIAAGNFHNVNGRNISTERKFTLSPGWNDIKTTQPYPTLNGNNFDVNTYTKKVCPAGIIIPDDVDIMRPYKDSMRQISPFSLAVSNKDEKECFAYENGKVYLNYMPEYIDPRILNDPYYGNVTGERFLCRSATYSADLKNTQYNPIPEKFALELKYKVNGEQRNMYVKIELSSAGTSGNARVFRLGLNKFKEDE